jgi:hypothetical protein
MVATEGTYIPYGGGAQLPWRLALPLVRLFWEIDQRWPGRHHTLDGTIGDDAHKAGVTDLDHDGDVDEHDAALKSQHNPDTSGWVYAGDIDKIGVNPDVIIAAVIAHPAAWYVIYRGVIYSRTHGWQPRPYRGSDPHTSHLHVSLLMTPAAAQMTVPWGIYPAPMITTTGEHPMGFIIVAQPDATGPGGQYVYDCGRAPTPIGRADLLNAMRAGGVGGISMTREQVTSLIAYHATADRAIVDAVVAALHPLLSDGGPITADELRAALTGLNLDVTIEPPPAN